MKCKRYLCAPLNADPKYDSFGFALPPQEPFAVHHEACPLWDPPLPVVGERLTFGVHRQTIADAESAPAWSPLRDVDRGRERAYRRWVKGS